MTRTKTRTLSDLTERIFAHAMGLHQAGRLKNTIHAFDQHVFIFNSDHTVLLKFETSGKDKFTKPVSFSANDYDSDNFYIDDEGRIAFVTDTDSGFTRTKTCGVPQIVYSGVKEIFEDHHLFAKANFHNRLKLHKNIIPQFNEGLSHIEFLLEGGESIIKQRDIYSGSIIKLAREKDGFVSVSATRDKILKDFGPMGMRTNDLIALFGLQEDINLFFGAGDPENQTFCMVTGKIANMVGFISGCLYDELGTTQQSKGKINGWKKPKNRRGQQKAAPKTVKSNEEPKKTGSKFKRQRTAGASGKKADGLF